ncbi:MAG: enoyl-CoA hydratase/isomerase family protein [Candidatus Eisenbacteria bacterium]
MTTQETIRVERSGPVATVVLNRPEIHNAFNDVMLSELTAAFGGLGSDDGVRVVVITGEGKSFCAGADLEWMKRMAEFTYEQNVEDSRRLAECMHRLDRLPKATVAKVNGAVVGGGMGLLAACDIAVASERAKFGLSEVKLGLAPAVISPFVIRKLGPSKARELFLTGERLDARGALAAGLVSRTAPPEGLDAAVDEVVACLLSSGPEAIRACKELVARVPGMDTEEVMEYTADLIARLRAGGEGREGMGAFLEKRAPSWRSGA